MAKAQATRATIPFQFFTASSRLPLRGFWSGPNAVTDLTFEPGMAEALGYTSPQIEQHFATQLTWLQYMHRLTIEQLRELIERWYGHRWSPQSDQQVFSPSGVHQLMSGGTFEPSWAAVRASNMRLLISKPLMSELVRSLLSVDGREATIAVDRDSLVDPRPPDAVGKPLPDQAQKALMVAAGIVAIHPDEHSRSSSVVLTIANLDTRQAVMALLDYQVNVPGWFNYARQVEA